MYIYIYVFLFLLQIQNKPHGGAGRHAFILDLGVVTDSYHPVLAADVMIFHS